MGSFDRGCPAASPFGFGLAKRNSPFSNTGREMNLDGFNTVEFPSLDGKTDEFVYVLCWDNGSRLVPFYVGQTTRIWGRMDDYYWANFAACTDFRVGEAVRHLSTKGRVLIKYKCCVNSREEERNLIEKLGGKRRLLNGVRAYDYRKADRDKERSFVCEQVDRIVSLDERHPSVPEASVL